MAGVKISALPAVPSAQLTDVFPAVQGGVTYKESNSQLLTLLQSNGTALTEVNDTNVTLTLGGSPLTALLNPVSLNLGWTGVLSPARGGTGENNGASTLTLGGPLTTVGAFSATFNFTNTTNVTFPTSGTLATVGSLPTPAALTETNDTNVTMSLAGSPSTALLQAVQMTLGWQGTLSGARGGTGVANTGSTITLGGSLTTSGAFTSTFTMTNTTAVTFPTSGTLATVGNTVASITGTANQVIASNPTGAVTLSLPQSIATTSAVAFGSLQITTPTTSGIYDSNNNLILNTIQVGSAQNYVAVFNNVTGSPPGIATEGINADVGLTIQTKGLGNIAMYNGSNLALVLTAVASAVNYIDLVQSATGNAPIIAAAGSDANVALTLQVKAAGGVVVSSSTLANGFELVPNATTFNSTFASFGSDSNIGMNIQGKGTGSIFLGTQNANYIQASGAASLSSPTITFTGSDSNVIGTLKGTGTGGITIAGTTAADNAAAGYVGELLESANATAVAMTSTNITQIQTLSLTAGDWDVWATFYTAVGGTTTVSHVGAQLHTTTATIAAPTTAQLASIMYYSELNTTGIPTYLNTGISRWNVSGATTVYLNAVATYGTSTLTGNGMIHARRRR